MKTKIKWLALAAAALTLNLGAASCSSESKTPSGSGTIRNPNRNPSRQVKNPASSGSMPPPTSPDFANSKENIARDLAKAKEAGFTDIVVDVRPTTGDVLFRSKVGDPVQWLGAWLPQGYSKVERTATWDYLQAFIDEGRKLGLRIHAAFNTFPGGNATSIGNEGVVFRDAERPSGPRSSTSPEASRASSTPPDYSAKFFNPVLPEVQEYLCSMLEELAAYDGLEGIFLDRGRFDGFTSDFSDYTRKEFEKYIGATVVNFPADILPAGHKSGLPSTQPPT